jgi:hypothetical protein
VHDSVADLRSGPGLNPEIVNLVCREIVQVHLQREEEGGDSDERGLVLHLDAWLNMLMPRGCSSIEGGVRFFPV